MSMPLADGPPLVLLHGLAADALTWFALDPLLPKGQAVRRLEMPGHGRTPAPDRPAIEALTGWLAAEIGAGPSHLVGHSLGGAVALAHAAAASGTVRSLTLIAPPGLGALGDLGVVERLITAETAEALGPALNALAARPGAFSSQAVAAAFALRRDAGLRASQHALFRALFTEDGLPDLRDALAGACCPVRLIWGQDDPIVPWRTALHAPGHCALHLLPRTGHLPHIEAPHTVARILAEITGHAP